MCVKHISIFSQKIKFSNMKLINKSQSYRRDCTEFSNTCICLGILLFPKYRFSPDPAGLGKEKLFVFFAEKKIKKRNSCLINVMINFLS